MVTILGTDWKSAVSRTSAWDFVLPHASLLDKVRRCDIGEACNVEPLLHRREISAMMVWPRDQNDPEKIGETSPAGYGPEVDQKPSDLAWSHLGMEPAKLSEVAEDRESFKTSKYCCLRDSPVARF